MINKQRKNHNLQFIDIILILTPHPFWVIFKGKLYEFKCVL